MAGKLRLARFRQRVKASAKTYRRAKAKAEQRRGAANAGEKVPARGEEE